MQLVYIFIAGLLTGLGIAAALYAGYQWRLLAQVGRRHPTRWTRV